MFNILFVFLGGGIGASLRYLITVMFYRFCSTSFPVGTFFINIVGSFFLGFITALALHKSGIINSQLKLFLTVGIAGGFTTFSTFSYESMELMRNGQYGLSMLYLFVSPILGLLGVYLATITARHLV